MTTTHASMDWFAGDDWEIRATLIDENGVPYDLSGTHEIKWSLVNHAHVRVLDEDDAVITVTDALAGKCTIMIPAAKTVSLPRGHYQDAIRIVIGGITSTLATGPIYVTDDPWVLAEPLALRRAS